MQGDTQPKPPGVVTALLCRIRTGDAAAREQLIAVLYPELRKLAARLLRPDERGRTLQPTALVHELFLKLAGEQGSTWQDRTHFFAVAAQLMRRILVDHARRSSAAKRGGGAVAIPLDDLQVISNTQLDLLLQVDTALCRLAALDPNQVRIVELRYFCGFSVEETAAATGLSPRTVNREWTLAQSWLRRELGAQP
jgi:RNA polymerase sigma factor (TIGR02999 family)